MFTLPGRSIMNIFSPPKVRLPPPPPPLPDRSAALVQSRKRQQLAFDKRRGGIGGSILTSGLGVIEEADVEKPSLLGQVNV
jgi:hypothetical protein